VTKITATYLAAW